MSKSLTSSQRVVAKVFRQKFPLSTVYDASLVDKVERFIVEFDNRVIPLNSTTAMDFIGKFHHGNSKDSSVEIRNILCALCVFMTSDHATIISMEELKAQFRYVPEFAGIDDSEWDRLLKYHSIVKTSVDLFGTYQQKGRVLFIANHLVGVEDPEDPLRGQKFSTGSGASKAARRRAIIYQTISGVVPDSRKKRSLEETMDPLALPDTATEEQRREMAKALAKIEQIKRACLSTAAPAPAPVVPKLPMAAPALVVNYSSSSSFPTHGTTAISILAETLSNMERSSMNNMELSGFSVLGDLFDDNAAQN